MPRISLEKLLEASGQDLVILSDFDHTLTKYGSCITHQAFDPKMTVKLDDETESLEKMQSEMNSRFTARLGSVAEEERDQLLTDWWSESHEILRRAGISKETVRESVKFLRFRQETSDILTICESHAIPFIIVSAGLDAVIQEGICQLLGHLPSNVEIVANQMVFDRTDHLTGFGHIIHSENKKVIVLGDTEEDLRVLDHRFCGNSYSISVNPKRKTPGFDQQFREEGLGSVLDLLKNILTCQ